MTALYCEIDPFAAAWLRELIKAGQIAPGDVTETPLEDLLPHDVSRYTQVHLCAGIGVWSYALRNIGWSDNRRIWSASFPCQPFSAAGKGLGFADERHLWPLGLHLIQQCRPDVIVGEQVASKDGLAWFDVVQADLEASGYAVGAVDTCAAGFGAPHIRQRLYWVAHSEGRGRGELWNAPLTRQGRHIDCCGDTSSGMAYANGNQSRGRGNSRSEESQGVWAKPSRRSDVGGLANPSRSECEAGCGGDLNEEGEKFEKRFDADRCCECGRLADAVHDRPQGGKSAFETGGGRRSADAGGASGPRPGPTNGFWRNPDWLFCRDGKWRPVEPGTFPLAYGTPARVGRLRGYGNAIVAQAAEEFLRAALIDTLVI